MRKSALHPPTPLLFVLLALPLAPPSRALAQEDAAARVDEIFARWSSTATPGCAVGVARAGERVLERAYGMADLERDVVATPATIYEAGSVSKQFTAAAILLLAQEGRLSLDDDIRKHVPEIPDYGTPITIRHLMNHTSGLRDWGSVASIAGWGRSERTHTHEHVLDILSRQRALNFTPGQQYSYSNSGYNLQAVIVERVSGMPFAEFSRRRLFEPLGMTSTQWRDDYTRIVKGRSIAYAPSGDGFRIDHPIENVHGNGGLLTTVGDMLIWNERLATGEGLGGARFVDEMHRQGVLNDGSTISYALGLQVGTSRGVRRVSHTGSTAGFRAFLARYPDQRLSVALLCNVGSASPGGLGQAVADVFLGDALLATSGQGGGGGGGGGAGRGAGPSWTPTPADLAAFAGEYYSPDAETTLVVVVEEGRLVALRRPADRIGLRPVAEGRFAAGGGLGEVRFIREGGRVTQLAVSQDRVFDLRFDRVR